MVNFGVSKVVDSTHPVFAAGDLVWGLCGWEEYSLITQPETLHKINHLDLPLSYYTGVLGESILVHGRTHQFSVDKKIGLVTSFLFSLY